MEHRSLQGRSARDQVGSLLPSGLPLTHQDEQDSRSAPSPRWQLRCPAGQLMYAGRGSSAGGGPCGVHGRRHPRVAAVPYEPRPAATMGGKELGAQGPPHPPPHQAGTGATLPGLFLLIFVQLLKVSDVSYFKDFSKLTFSCTP